MYNASVAVDETHNGNLCNSTAYGSKPHFNYRVQPQQYNGHELTITALSGHHLIMKRVQNSACSTKTSLLGTTHIAPKSTTQTLA
jgi:hypothetical protein